MPTDPETAGRVLDSLAMPEETRIRAMMGDYVLYFRERVVGGIYDGRLLIKMTPSALRLLPEAGCAVPYPGAKEMLTAGDMAGRELRSVFEAMLPELPQPRSRRKKTAGGNA